MSDISLGRRGAGAGVRAGLGAGAGSAVMADLAAYNAERVRVHESVRRRVLLYLGLFALVAVPAILFAGWVVFAGQANGGGYLLGIVLVIFAVAGVWIHSVAVEPAKKLQQGFRDRLIPAAFGFTERPAYTSKVEPASFKRMPKAAVAAFNRVTVDDCVTGRFQDFDFELYEARLTYKTSKQEQEAFRGIIMAFPMPKPFPGTLVATKTVGGVSRFFRDLFGKGGLESIESGNPALDGAYEFRSDNPAAARPLITGSFARALDRLREAWPEDAARVALSDGDAFLLLPTKKNFFELPHVSQACDYRQHVEPIVSDATALLATAVLVRKIR